jgi:hypothetical protein
MSADSPRDIADEVTRFSGVASLQGATGHGIGSLGFLLGGIVGFVVLDSPSVGFGGVVSASLLSANGVSIYLWDRIRDAVIVGAPNGGDTANQSPDEESGRTLSPPSLSAEHKAELVGGLGQIVGLLAVLAGVIGAVRVLGVERGSYLLGGLLAAGNLAALAFAWRDTDG